jgi:hypothetical protein
MQNLKCSIQFCILHCSRCIFHFLILCVLCGYSVWRIVAIKPTKPRATKHDATVASRAHMIVYPSKINACGLAATSAPPDGGLQSAFPSPQPPHPSP